MFKTIERDALTVYGWLTTLEPVNSAAGLAALSKQKMLAKENYEAKVEGSLLAVNAVIEGAQSYLIGSADSSDARLATFTLPAGTYAQFELVYQNQMELDQLIGQSYGELSQSEAYQIAGNFNLEEYSGAGKITFYAPIGKKTN